MHIHFLIHSFDRPEIFIRNIDLIEYNKNAIHHIEFKGFNILISMGLYPDLATSSEYSLPMVYKLLSFFSNRGLHTKCSRAIS